MKSNKWRKIIIKNPKLQQVRKNLRTIITLAVDDQIRKIRKENALILDQIKKEYIKQGGKVKDSKIEEPEMTPESSTSNVSLTNARYDSILLCAFGSACSSYPSLLPCSKVSQPDASLDKDMVWNPIDKQWICINCYNELFGTDTLKNAYKAFVDRERRIDDKLAEEIEKGTH